jgi:hypothetical protein
MGMYVPAHPDCVTERKAGVTPDKIVVHTAEGSAKGTIRWFQMGRADRAASWAKRLSLPVDHARVVALSFPTAAHFVIAGNGDVTQMVLEKMKCSHANAYNSRSVGIEHEGRANVGGFPDAMLDASAKLVADICKRRGLPLDRTTIIGHNEVPGATHQDPGGFWNWTDYMQRVELAAAVAAAI